MPKAPRLAPSQAERLLLEAGFTLIRAKGGHRIYGKQERRCVAPFHAGKNLHPKLVKQVMQAIEPE